MKKVILITLALILALCPAVLAACSSVNQINAISVSWSDYEQFKFNIYEGDSNASIGTMSMTFERILAETVVEVGGDEYTVKEGAIISTELEITSGTYLGDKITSKVLVKSSLVPVASYKVFESNDENRAYTSKIVYTKKKAYITVNGKETSFKAKNCYDNDSLYTLARASRLSDSSYTLSIAGVDNLQGGTRTVAFGKANNVTLTNALFCDDANVPKELNCYHVTLSTAAKYGSSTQAHIYLAVEKQDVKRADDSVVRVLKVPLKIVEGDFSYILTEVKLDK